MFETAELGHRIPKKEYRKLEVELRQELLTVQRELRRVDHSQVLLLFSGVDGAGKGETVNLLNAWMDPRWLINQVFDPPADLERERPEFWRYWLALPPRGRIGMFMSAWYSTPVLDRVFDRIDERGFDARLDRIIAFENALADDGAVICKFWMHLSRDAQKQRFETLEADPLMRARVTERDWRHWERYDDFIAVAEHAIMRTHTGKAPWHIVEGADANYRGITVGTTVRDTLARRLRELEIRNSVETERENHAEPPQPKKDAKSKSAASSRSQKGSTGKEMDTSTVTVLSRLDMSQRLGKAEYAAALKRSQAELLVMHREARERGLSTILVFEGPDAAGKGGAIRRLTAALDARNYQVHGMTAPTDEERAQHYLWRFWRNLSRLGRITIFDRSWYGRVLVERVEGFATEEEWRRAYAEINDFEAQLIEHDIVLVKVWIHVTKEEQLARFEERQRTPHKRWKLTQEDWRNRERWAEYELAVNDMVQYTSTHAAPWTLVPGNDKRFARVKVLETVCGRLGAALEHEPLQRPEPTRALSD